MACVQFFSSANQSRIEVKVPTPSVGFADRRCDAPDVDMNKSASSSSTFAKQSHTSTKSFAAPASAYQLSAYRNPFIRPPPSSFSKKAQWTAAIQNIRPEHAHSERAPVASTWSSRPSSGFDADTFKPSTESCSSSSSSGTAAVPLPPSSSSTCFLGAHVSGSCSSSTSSSSSLAASATADADIFVKDSTSSGSGLGYKNPNSKSNSNASEGADPIGTGVSARSSLGSSPANPFAPLTHNKVQLADAHNPRVRYVLHRRLRHSLFGEVYTGTDRLTGQRVAVKVCVRDLVHSHTSRNGADVLEDPLQEAAIMRQVGTHNNVVKLVDTHVDPQLYWIVQEYVAGGELFDLLVRCTRFHEKAARHFFTGIVSGLRHLHSRSVCHLDLSLENVLVDANHTAKICDFGLARVFEPGQRFPASPDCKPGKVNYMAPEVLAGKEFDGVKADVFALGVILYAMLTGQSPFSSAAPDDRRYCMIAEGKLLHLLISLRLSTCVSSSACDLITRMLSRDPDRRPTLDQICAHQFVKGGIPS